MLSEDVSFCKNLKKAGFDMVTISEHFHPWVDDHSASNFTWTTLGALAKDLKDIYEPSL